MKTSPAGIKALADREGRRLTAYRDTKGIWTIGIGHTSAAGPPTVSPGKTITSVQCDEIFARDLAKYEATVNEVLKRPIGQNAFDACVSLCYNIGQHGFAGSTVVKRINAGDMYGASEAFMMWDKPPKIRKRRTSERDQFLKPDHGVVIAPPSPPPPDVLPPEVLAPYDPPLPGEKRPPDIEPATSFDASFDSSFGPAEKKSTGKQVAVGTGLVVFVSGLLYALAHFFHIGG